MAQNGRLRLSAEHPPTADLLAEPATHNIEILNALNAANYSMLSSALLAHVSRLLNTCPGELLEGGHLEQHDLVELAGTDPTLEADIIRTSPTWINPPRQIEQTAEVHAVEKFKPQRTVRTAATASKAWRKASAAHINHLMKCRECYAPLSRYCAAGRDLRQLYNRTPGSTMHEVLAQGSLQSVPFQSWSCQGTRTVIC